MLSAFLIISILFGFSLYIFGVSIVNGWVLTKLWLWFIVPVFGCKSLTLGLAIGISLIVRFLTIQSSSVQTMIEEDTSWGRAIAVLLAPFSTALFALGFGYLLHLYL